MPSKTLTGRVSRKPTPEQVERIIDTFSQTADTHRIAELSGIGLDIVRNALDDPEIAKKAMRRKKSVLGIFLVGEAIDSLQTIVREGKSATHVLKAVELIQDILEEGSESGVALVEEETPVASTYEEAIGLLKDAASES